jgi:ribosomal protein L13
MFKKLVVVDAKGHLLGRLASYIAKTLLSGKSPLTQAKELQSSGLKASISPAHSSETRLNSQNS